MYYEMITSKLFLKEVLQESTLVVSHTKLITLYLLDVTLTVTSIFKHHLL